MCLKWLVTAAFGSSEPFSLEKWAWRVGAIPTVIESLPTLQYTALVSLHFGTVITTSFNEVFLLSLWDRTDTSIIQALIEFLLAYSHRWISPWWCSYRCYTYLPNMASSSILRPGSVWGSSLCSLLCLHFHPQEKTVMMDLHSESQCCEICVQ